LAQASFKSSNVFRFSTECEVDVCAIPACYFARQVASGNRYGLVERTQR